MFKILVEFEDEFKETENLRSEYFMVARIPVPGEKILIIEEECYQVLDVEIYAIPIDEIEAYQEWGVAGNILVRKIK